MFWLWPSSCKLDINYAGQILKGTGQRRFVRFFCSINFCFGPFEIRQFKTNSSVLKIDWDLPTECSYLRNAYYVITYCCFTHIFVDSACKQLTMASSQAPNLLRPNNSLGDLTDDGVNNFMCLFE